MRVVEGTPDVVPVESIRPHPMNANQGDVGAIHESIEVNGFYGRAIVQKSTGFILVGTHRWKGAVAAGADELPIDWVDVSDAEAIRIMEADNATARKATMDIEQRAVNLQTIIEEFGSLAGSGADEDDLNDILVKLQGFNESDVTEQRIEKLQDQLIKKWGVEKEQVWVVPSLSIPGIQHRILCADIRQGTIAIDRLMDGYHAHMVYTDPPYNVDYESETLGRVQNDNLPADQFEALLTVAFQMAARASRPDAGIYIWHASATRRAFERAMERAGFEEKQYIVWAKESFVMGRADYHWQHEPCFYAQKRGCRAWFTETREQSTVWRITPRAARQDEVAVALTNTNGAVVTLGDGTDIYIGPQVPKGKKFRAISIPDGGALVLVPSEQSTDLWEVRRDDRTSYLHPTQKPSALAGRAIMNSTAPGMGVLDVFGGSGSTLVACEQLGRRGFIMDMAPGAIAACLESMAILGPDPRARAMSGHRMATCPECGRRAPKGPMMQHLMGTHKYAMAEASRTADESIKKEPKKN